MGEGARRVWHLRLGRLERERCLREARRYLPSPDAEDAVQEALLRAWRKRHMCLDPSAPLPWLLAITRSEALRILDRSRRSADPAGHVAERGEQDWEVEAVPDRLDFKRLLAAVSEDDRALLELRYRDDLGHAAIAARLGISEGAVRVRLHRLHRRLKAALEAGSGR